MMRRRISFLINFLFLIAFAHPSFAWTGESPFEAMSRESILRRATEMVHLSWSPKATFSNWVTASMGVYTFYQGTVYYGEAYTQDNPQQNWAEFYNAVSYNVSGGTYYLGNDCSGFVSISWKLPTRYATSNFESDAITEGGYVTTLGPVGSSHNVTLLPGDALVTTGHIILFESYLPDGSGILALEQTPYLAVRTSKYTWARLAQYRPIRRNLIDEGDYTFVTKWGTPGIGNGQLYYPWGVEVDSSGNVYVADTANSRVQKFDNNGSFISKWGTTGCGDGQFQDPHDIAIDIFGNVIVAEGARCLIYPDYESYVQKFTSSGSFLTKWTMSGQGSYWSEGVATDSSGAIYVTDKTSSNVQKFTNNGGLITKWGIYGSGSGQFYNPTGIAVDMFDNVYVSDTSNNRIQKFSSTGTFLSTWGICCAGDGNFSYPMGVATDVSGNVYVVDVGNVRIQKFAGNGNFLTKWGGGGNNDGQFIGPTGVAVDSQLNVFVVDEGSHRIQKFRPITPYPSRPTFLAANAISSSQIRLSWADNSNNETGFVIARKSGIRGSYSVIAQGVAANTTTFVDTVPASGTYYYVVYAFNDWRYSAYSNEAFATAKTQSAGIMDVPTGIFEYIYDLVDYPVLNVDPSLAKPSSIKNTVTGGASASNFPSDFPTANDAYYGPEISAGTLTFRVAFLPFDAPVDIYIAIYAPIADPNYWWYKPDNVGQSNAAGVAIWRENTVGPIDEIIFSDLAVSSLTPAIYYIFTMVTPAGDTSYTNYYMWSTSFEVRPQCSDLPVMIPRYPWIYYSTLQSSFNGVSSGETIRCQAKDFIENPNFNRNVVATLKGGYYCGYSIAPSHSDIKGTLTISNGTLVIENIVLE